MGRIELAGGDTNRRITGSQVTIGCTIVLTFVGTRQHSSPSATLCHLISSSLAVIRTSALISIDNNKHKGDVQWPQCPQEPQSESVLH